jgi:hypothetical protein
MRVSVETAVVGEGNSLKNNLRFWISNISAKKERVQNHSMYTVKKVSEFAWLVTYRLRTGKSLLFSHRLSSWHYCRRQCFFNFFMFNMLANKSLPCL